MELAKLFAIFCVVALGTACGKREKAETPTEKPPVPAEKLVMTSTIRGAVNFSGTPPQRQRIRMGTDPQCAAQHPADGAQSEDIIVNDNGTLRNVFVYVKKGAPKLAAHPSAEALLDQIGCQYRPRVLGMVVRQPLRIRNSDPTLHNVHAMPRNSREFNLGQPVKGMEHVRTFAAPEVMVRFKCDVHPWMAAYIGVLEHPFFAVTGEDGGFELPKLPAGEYVLEAWHERFGTQSLTVSVAENKTKSVEFNFAAGEM
jgi:hypothetical protein